MENQKSSHFSGLFRSREFVFVLHGIRDMGLWCQWYFCTFLSVCGIRLIDECEDGWNRNGWSAVDSRTCSSTRMLDFDRRITTTRL